MSNPEVNDQVYAKDLQGGDLLYDPAKTGTHSQRVKVQWTGHHERRKRTYVAGVEEHSSNPVTLAYDDEDSVEIFRANE